MGQLGEDLRMLRKDTRIRLKDGLGIAPHILANRHDTLVWILAAQFRILLIHRCPADIPHIHSPLQKQILGFTSLHPDLVHHLGIRLPGLIGPLLIGNPDVLAGIGKECGIDNLNEEVYLSLGTGGKAVRNMANLCVLIEDMRNQAVKNGDVLRNARILAETTDKVNPHYSISCYALCMRNAGAFGRCVCEGSSSSKSAYRVEHRVSWQQTDPETILLDQSSETQRALHFEYRRILG